jgi:hypothetical protein
MYFKIIYNNLVIDILDSIQYVRWLKRGRKFVKTEMTSANGILASDNLNIYHVDGMPEFEGVKNYKTVRMVEITKEEYDKLNSLIVRGDVVYSDESAFSKEEKLELELKALRKQLAAVSNQGLNAAKELVAVKAQNSDFVEKLEGVLKGNSDLSEKIASIEKITDGLKDKLGSILSL